MGKDSAGDVASSSGNVPLQPNALAQLHVQQHNIQHLGALQLHVNLANLNQLQNAAGALMGLGGGACSSNNPPAGSGIQRTVGLIHSHG